MTFSPEGLVNSQPIDNLRGESWKGLWIEFHAYVGGSLFGGSNNSLDEYMMNTVIHW